MPESFSQTVGATVRAEMARRKITQRQVAEKLGISQTQVSRRLDGTVSFNVDELEAVAQVLGLPVALFVAQPTATAERAA